MSKFKLNTAIRSTSRVRGWSCTSDLLETLNKVWSREEKKELLLSCSKELVKAKDKYAADNAEYERVRNKCFELKWSSRMTKGALRKIGARCDRSFNKVNELEKAVKQLVSELE